MKLCECGCGQPAPVARQTLASRGYVKGQPVRFVFGHHNRVRQPTGKSAYKMVYVPEHPHASPSGCVAEHILIVERAIGKYLRRSADVHHVDGNSRNNANTNLVACDSRGYHKLLHVRTRIVKAGGDPNTQHFCSTCKQLKSRSEFWASSARQIGLQNRCIACCKLNDQGRWRRGKKSDRPDWREVRKGRAA